MLMLLGIGSSDLRDEGDAWDMVVETYVNKTVDEGQRMLAQQLVR